MTSELYPWHNLYWQHLSAYVEQQRIPQALLINGLAGLGKQQLALYFAQYLMCANKQAKAYCGHCESCQLFIAKTHPDFIWVQPEEVGKAIGVDLIRSLIIKLRLKPQYSGFRVVLISPAEKMNNNSANAFLKCLEEPPERTMFILLAEKMQVLPATIISRCQKLLLLPPKLEEVGIWLREQGVTEHQELLLNLAEGAPLLALDYAQSHVLEQRQSCFSEWQNIPLANACPIELAEKWYKLPANQILPWLISWTEDIIRCHFNVESSLLRNADLEKHLNVLSKQLDLQSLYEFLRLLLTDMQRIQTQLNKQLLFEEILITWALTVIKK
ncbi:MAG: DNA polymerase III subunit delta' [Methyloprofundus sp.]|nr:DNA polymerase III subunit delta' [Methyloprofundus sp.]MDT8425425.1 DNA polymerase III subunit delta' [Methyloprofundus sp.]